MKWERNENRGSGTDVVKSCYIEGPWIHFVGTGEGHNSLCRFGVT